MPGKKPAPQQQPKTLMEMHDALVSIRPDQDAPLEQWQAYYYRSAVLYTEIAEIDRGHHHEALYWAERELAKSMLVTNAIKKEQPPGTSGLNPRSSPNKKREVNDDEGRQAVGCADRTTPRTPKSAWQTCRRCGSYSYQPASSNQLCGSCLSLQ